MGSYLSTTEAASLLGVTSRRVVELIASGQLPASKVGGRWLIDAQDVEARRLSVRKNGGRPSAGSRRGEAKYALMNRNYVIAELVFDHVVGEFTHVSPLADAARAPLGIIGADGKISPHALTTWWNGRRLSAERVDLPLALAQYDSHAAGGLALLNLGLSLSDQYWINPLDDPLVWGDVNFFSNDFERLDFGYLFPELSGGRGIGHSPKRTDRHPDNTSDGVLPKHWEIRKGIRTLVKGGSGNCQEPFNEVVATALHARVLTRGDYVPYTLETGSGTGAGTKACSCPLFISDEEEFISAMRVIDSRKKAAHHNNFQHYLETCAQLGIPDARSFVSKMIVCDDIMANTDRHWRNFGLIRNVETLEYRVAPIFDTGTSLWCHRADLDIGKSVDYGFISQPFREVPARQLQLVDDFDWVDVDMLHGFVEEALGILSKNPLLASRLDFLERAIRFRVERIAAISREFQQ